MAPLNFIFLYYIFLGVAPGLVWLIFYLRKDTHPEPKRVVFKIFFLGMAAAAFSVLIESLISEILFRLDGQKILIQAFYIFFGVALVEEYLKYLAVERKTIILKNGVLRESEFDEPIDVMLYMIIAGLGFATLENILLFFSENLPLIETVSISIFRFIGATFLHALCSGNLGFFMALSFFERKRGKILLFTGFFISTFLHGLYNFSIMKIEGDLKFLIPAFILIFLACFVSFSFRKIKKLASICKI